MRRHAVVLVPLLLVGCAPQPPSAVDGESRAEPGATCVPSSPVAAPLPAGYPELPAGAELTEVADEQVSGRVVGEVEQVLEHFRSAVDRAGYVVQREEDEGRSAQLGFFGVGGTGTATIAALTCPSGSTGFTLRVTRSTG